MGRCTRRNLDNMRAYVLQHYGESAGNAWIASLLQEDQQAFSTATIDAMYDETIHVRILKAFCVRFRGGSTSIAFELGRFSAAMDLTTGRSFYFHTVRPSFFVRNLTTFWRRDHDTGSWELEICKGEFIATLCGWEGHSAEACQRLLGYMTCLLESFGPIRSYSHAECRSFGADRCLFQCRWYSMEEEPPPSVLISSSSDLLLAMGEIAASTTLAHLYEVIICVFRYHFACHYVSLAMGDEMEPIACSGEVVRSVRSFDLNVASRTIGKLDVEPPQKWPDWLTEEILQRVVSLFAYMLDAELHRTPTVAIELPTCVPSGILTAEESVARRVAKAAKEWRLTDRESQVLRLFALGYRIVDIVAKLGCSRSNIDHHMAEIRRKAKVKSSLELLVKFFSIV